MITIDSGMIPGSDLLNKGCISLTSSLSFIIQYYLEFPLLFKNPCNTDSFASEFTPDDVLLKSLQLFIRNHYAPLTEWVEVEDTDIYLTWVNYKDGVYSPTFPARFETVTIDTDYDSFCKMIEDRDPCLYHSKTPLCYKSHNKKEPLLFFRITRLGPDSQAVLVNYSISYMAMDGFSGAHFCLNWAALCRQTLEDPELQSLSEGPSYVILHPPLFGVLDFSKFRDPDNKNYREQVGDKIEDTENSRMFSKSLGACDKYNLAISESRQKEIRDESHLSGVTFHTHLFAILVKEEMELQVLQKPEIDEDVATLDTVTDMRSKLGVPANFCSSTALGFCTKIKIKYILEMNTADIAREIKDKFNDVASPESICGAFDKDHSLWKSVCLRDGDSFEEFEAERQKRLMAMPRFMVNSMATLGVGRMDLGSGAPETVFMPKLSDSGLIIIAPRNPNAPDNSIKMKISIPKIYAISQIHRWLSELDVWGLTRI